MLQRLYRQGYPRKRTIKLQLKILPHNFTLTVDLLIDQELLFVLVYITQEVDKEKMSKGGG